MTAVIETDTAMWLHNKLGNDEDQWSTGGIASSFTRDLLRSIYDVFLELKPKTKAKVLLSFLEIPLRQMEEVKEVLSEILSLAECDADEWVRISASIIKDYPFTGMLNVNLSHVVDCFGQMNEEIVSEAKATEYSQCLYPLDALYLSRAALTQKIGHLPAPAKHFTLKRKPKSAALRAQITQKASDAANLLRALSTGPSAGGKKPSLSRQASSSSGWVPPVYVKSGLSKLSLSVKKTGTKMLDISDQPVAGKDARKKRKPQDSEADQKSKHSRGSSTGGAGTADLSDSGETKPGDPVEEASDSEKEEEQGESRTSQPSPSTPEQASEPPQVEVPTTVTPSYAMLPGSSSSLSFIPSHVGPSLLAAQGLRSEIADHSLNDPSTLFARQNFHRELQMHMQHEHERSYLQQQQQMHQQLLQQMQHTPQAQFPLGVSMTLGAPGIGISHRIPQMQVPPPMQAQVAAAMSQQMPQKKRYSLTGEQTLAAHEMFKSATRVTRAEKALILGFMAGARENPFPQQGPVITIKLSEDTEVVRQQDGSQQQVFVEMLFEMNYDTGNWRRLKRTRPIS